MNNASKLFALLLSGAIAFGTFGTAASAASVDTAEDDPQTIVTDDRLPDSSVLLEGYLRSRAGIKESRSSKLPEASGRIELGEKEQVVYDILFERIAKIANGELPSASFVVTKEELRSHLGPKAEFKGYDFSSVIRALVLDHPYELYWYDKTKGVHTTVSKNGIDQEFSFSVSCDYILSPASPDEIPDPYAVDPEKIASVKASVETAKDIVNSVDPNWSDFHAMTYFKDKICSLVSYNFDAVTTSTGIVSGNPWELIYVFDNDPDTNVVCEGYAKAFKFLCDMYTFKSDVKCNLVSGKMVSYAVNEKKPDYPDDGHMWNHVAIGDSSYLVDITNSDSESIGKDGGLFFNGADAGCRDVDGSGDLHGFTIKIGSYALVDYTYDEETLKMYSQSELDIARTAPTLHTIVWKNEKGDILETDELTADGERPVYNGKEPVSAGKKFIGWSPDITDKTVVRRGSETVTYTAVFEQTAPVKTYKVDLVMPVRILDQTVEAEEGGCVEIPDDLGYVPEEIGCSLGQPDGWYYDRNFTETFDLATPVTSDLTIYAGYRGVTRWYDDDGTMLCEIENWFGEMPNYPYDDPVKLPDEEYEYKFKGWRLIGGGSQFDGWVDHEAVYEAIPGMCHVTWLCDGEVFAAADYPLHAAIKHPEGTPEKPGYVFLGWDKPNGTTAEGDTVFEALFKKEPEPERTRVFGDANNDSAIDSNDALLMIRHSIGLDKLTGEDFFFADVDENSVVDTGDAVTTLRYSVGFRDIEKMGQKIRVPDDL